MRVSATRNRLKGGKWSRAFKSANVVESIIYGATILKIYNAISTDSGIEREIRHLPIMQPSKKG